MGVHLPVDTELNDLVKPDEEDTATQADEHAVPGYPIRQLLGLGCAASDFKARAMGRRASMQTAAVADGNGGGLQPVPLRDCLRRRRR
jgi:hypothetical protein